MSKLEIRRLYMDGTYSVKKVDADIGFCLVEDRKNIGKGQFHSLVDDPQFRLHKPIQVDTVDEIKDAISSDPRQYVKDTEKNDTVLPWMLTGQTCILVDDQSPWPLTNTPPRDGTALKEQVRIAFNIIFQRKKALEKAKMESHSMNIYYLLGGAIIVMVVVLGVIALATRGS